MGRGLEIYIYGVGLPRNSFKYYHSKPAQSKAQTERDLFIRG
jgi:hypothetical protein